MPVDLKGNTNFACLKNLQDEYIVPRTNLAAIDINVANGLAITGNTMYVNLATSDDLANGTVGQLVDAAVLKPVLDAKQPVFTVGDLLENTSGTLNRKRYMNIVQEASIPTRSVTPIGSTVAQTALVLEPGNAYKITATSTSKWLATTAAFKAEQNTWGLEGHIELFVAGTGYVHTDDNVVLATPLEPDAVNNCTVRFHDGKAIISVEDTIAGYIVVTATGSSNGSLPYGLANNVGEYISFNDTLAGTVIDLGGVTTYAGEKHVVGNGYTDTVVSGSINCTNKTTVANLSLSDVQVTGGTLTLGDAYIPNGATVSVSGGQIAYERATIDGVCYNSGRVDLNGATINGSGTIDFGGSGGLLALTGTNTINGTTIQHGSRTDGGGMRVASDAVLYASGATFSGNETNTQGGAINVYAGGVAYLTDCVFDSNTASTYANAINVIGILNMYGCEFGNTQDVFIASAGNVNITGGATKPYTIGGTGKLTVSSGAILDLTGNTNATPIAPGGGVVIGSDVQIYPSAGSASAVEISGGTYTAITSGGELVAPVWVSNNETISGNATVTKSGTVDYLLGVYTTGENASVSGITFTQTGTNGTFYVGKNFSLLGVTCLNGGRSVAVLGNVTCTTSDCVFDGYISLNAAASFVIAGNEGINDVRTGDNTGKVTISSGASIALTNSIAPGGGITVLTGGCTVNGASITGGTYTAITSVGGSASATV